MSTIDLTKLTAPFGLLDEVCGEGTKDALVEHGGPYEIYTTNGWVDWPPISWCPSFICRVKPQPLTKPSPPWEHLADWVQYVARNEDGQVWAFAYQPLAYGREWIPVFGKCCKLQGFKFDPGTCDWRDSLVKRPEGM